MTNRGSGEDTHLSTRRRNGCSRGPSARQIARSGSDMTCVLPSDAEVPVIPHRRCARPRRAGGRQGDHAFVVLDWKDGELVGLEVLDASARLHPDLLDGAVRPGGGSA